MSTLTGSSPTTPPVFSPAAKKSKSFQAAPLFIIAVIIGIMMGAFILYRRRRGRQQRLVIAYPSNASHDLNLAPEGRSQRVGGSVIASNSSRSAASSAVITNSSRSVSTGAQSGSGSSKSISPTTESHKDGDEMKEVEIL